MKTNSAEFSIRLMSKVLEVSKSGYYAYLKRPDTGLLDAVLEVKIKETFDKSHGRYGYRKVTKSLQAEGIEVNGKCVRRIMKALGLRAKGKRKFKCTTDSKHHLPIAPNLMDRNFSASKRDEKWTGDITYIWTGEGWLYLAVFIDLYSRQVIGWSLSDRMQTSLVLDAFFMALWRRDFPKGVLIHTDRGSQYCSKEFQDVLKLHGFISSMSRKGNCWDNAPSESYFRTLKVELNIEEEIPKTRKEAREIIFNFIEVWYNRERLHSTLGYVSPVEFENGAGCA